MQTSLQLMLWMRILKVFSSSCVQRVLRLLHEATTGVGVDVGVDAGANVGCE